MAQAGGQWVWTEIGYECKKLRVHILWIPGFQ